MNDYEKTKEITEILKDFQGKVPLKTICGALVKFSWDIQKTRDYLDEENKKPIV